MIDYLSKKGTRYEQRLIISCVTGYSPSRYWGEPYTAGILRKKCGWVAIPESELPLELRGIDTLNWAKNGESPLAKAYDWINTTCPYCGGGAKRETVQCHSGQAQAGIF